jgi:hypothetical protein
VTLRGAEGRWIVRGPLIGSRRIATSGGRYGRTAIAWFESEYQHHLLAENFSKSIFGVALAGKGKIREQRIKPSLVGGTYVIWDVFCRMASCRRLSSDMK